MIFDSSSAKKWLFCFAHPDDELAMAAWMRRLCRDGAVVHAMWTHSVPRRESESRAVARLIGLGHQNLTYLDGGDGLICEQLAILEPTMRELVHRISPDRIVVCSFEQGHLDHDATNFLVHRVAQCPVFEFPLYHAYYRWYQTMGRFSTAEGAEMRCLDREEMAFKKEIAKMYPSQRIWSVLFWYEVFHRITLRRSRILDGEWLRPSEPRDWRLPNHPLDLARKIKASEKWRRWITSLDAWERLEPQASPIARSAAPAEVTGSAVTF